ncbi:hypothetical protein FDP41_009813 [Naegleria fowleri]|uniref:Uncharacterized protein n=1 Tax=Naegleria fowleri TaxID=5763 RepID=A0A6A5B0U8_NAEFO|nr:uncharacterized protein FDP41_009813 [Naegleria fowleri]KAF0972117.1 hypothetical protein FDP41_009813 [Naegleria fowleri]
MEDFDESFENYEPEEEHHDDSSSSFPADHEDHPEHREDEEMEQLYIPSSISEQVEHQEVNDDEKNISMEEDIYGNIYGHNEEEKVDPLDSSLQQENPSRHATIITRTSHETTSKEITENSSSTILEESFEDFQYDHQEEEDARTLQISSNIQLLSNLRTAATCQEEPKTTPCSNDPQKNDEKTLNTIPLNVTSSMKENNNSTFKKSPSPSNQTSSTNKHPSPVKKSDKKKPFSTVQDYDYTPYYQKRQKPYNEQEVKEYMKRKKAQEGKNLKHRQDSPTVTPYYLSRKKPYDEEKVKEFMKKKQERDRKKEEEEKQEIANNKKRRKELLKKLDDYVHCVFKELRENAFKGKTSATSKNKPEMPEFLKKQLAKEQDEKNSELIDPRKRIKEYGKKVREKLAEDHEKMMAERKLAQKITLEKKRREMHHLKLDLNLSHFKLRESDEQSEDSIWSNWSAPAKTFDLDPKMFKSKNDKYDFKVSPSQMTKHSDGESDTNAQKQAWYEKDEQRRKIIEEALMLIATSRQQASSTPKDDSSSRVKDSEQDNPSNNQTSESQEMESLKVISTLNDFSSVNKSRKTTSSQNIFASAIQSLLSRKTSSKEIQVSEGSNLPNFHTNSTQIAPNSLSKDQIKNETSIQVTPLSINQRFQDEGSKPHIVKKNLRESSSKLAYFERAFNKKMGTTVEPQENGQHSENIDKSTTKRDVPISKDEQEEPLLSETFEFASYNALKGKNQFNDMQLREQLERQTFWASTKLPEVARSSSIHTCGSSIPHLNFDWSDSSMDSPVIWNSELNHSQEMMNKQSPNPLIRKKSSNENLSHHDSTKITKKESMRVTADENSSSVAQQKKAKSVLSLETEHTNPSKVEIQQQNEMTNDIGQEIPFQISNPFMTSSENNSHKSEHKKSSPLLESKPLESCQTLTIEDDQSETNSLLDSKEFSVKNDEIKKVVFSMMKKQSYNEKKHKKKKKLISLINPTETVNDPFNIISTLREKKKHEQQLERRRRKEKVKQELSILMKERKERMKHLGKNVHPKHCDRLNDENNHHGTSVAIQTYPQVTIEYDLTVDEDECHKDHVACVSSDEENTTEHERNGSDDENDCLYDETTPYGDDTFANDQFASVSPPHDWYYTQQQLPPFYYPYMNESNFPTMRMPQQMVDNQDDTRLSPAELAEKLLDSLTVYEKVLESEARFSSLLALNN